MNNDEKNQFSQKRKQFLQWIKIDFKKKFQINFSIYFFKSLIKRNFDNYLENKNDIFLIDNKNLNSFSLICFANTLKINMFNKQKSQHLFQGGQKMPISKNSELSFSFWQKKGNFESLIDEFIKLTAISFLLKIFFVTQKKDFIFMNNIKIKKNIFASKKLIIQKSN